MPELIAEPSRVTAADEPPKLIDEYIGRVNSAEPVCLPAFAPGTVHRDE